MSQPSNTFGQDEVTHLRSQNDQLWKIIEKQRSMIQSLQKDNVRLSAERDGLQDKVDILEKELTRKQRVTSLLISPQTLSEIAEQGDVVVSTPTTELPILMPPPRSPYRAMKSDDFHSLDTLVMSQESDHIRSPTTTMDDLDHNNPSSLEIRKNSTRHSVLPSSRSDQEDSKPYLESMNHINVKVVGSNIKPNEKGKEVVSFTISVGSFKEEFEERWRVEKLYSDFLALDAKLKSQRNKSIANRIGKLPDKSLFSNNAPTKVDQRKIALEHYLQHVISLPLEDNSHLCEFLSTHVIDTKTYQISGQKEGYLTKRGKNFGGWKTRYFVLNESVLEYYESKDGIQLGSIRLINAQIGTQMQGSANDDSNSVYRHAFLIVEQRRMGSTHSVRHILCANSDEDRDSWVHALLQNIQIVEDDAYHQKHNKKKLVEKPRLLKSSSNHQPVVNSSKTDLTPSTDSSESGDTTSLPSAVQTWSSYDLARANQEQQRAARPGMPRRSSMGNLLNNSDQYGENRTMSPIIDDEETEKKSKSSKRMTFWGKKMFSSDSLLHETQQQQQQPRPSQSSSATTNNSSTSLRGFLSRSSHEQNQRHKQNEDVPTKPANQVFGVSLEEAVRISRVAEGYELPAIVYRCIEYLDVMNAVLEEGIYRLSGSNAMMKALRERFNREGDVDLLASQEHDVHVVAGLLKMWLRELPTNVLTREHRMEFLHVIDLLDRRDRINELGRLVSLLPLANYTLLRALTAHLIRVVQHSDINKMTMRNVSIVFSPTLGIPATVFNLFMSEFEYIFWTTKDGEAAPRKLDERVKEEHGRSNRNSVNYMDGAPHTIVDLEKNMEGSRVMLEDDEEVDDLTLSTDSSCSVNS